MTITIGADPELFVRRGDTIVSGIGMIGGDKERPRPVLHGAVQEDNVLAEFNIDPAGSADEFVRNLRDVQQALSGIIAPCVLDARSSHFFTRPELRSFGTMAMRFGCDPDYDAYTGRKNGKPSPYTELRTAGGHIHIGYADSDEYSNRRIVQVLDYTMGLRSVLEDDDVDRRKLYGKAGCYRNKPYGVEYRSLSNFWLRSEELQRWAYATAVDSVHKTAILEDMQQVVSADEVQRIINTSDRVAATHAIYALKEVV